MGGYPRRPRLPATRGFTLIEILVVIVIIGLMAAMAVLAIAGSSLDDKIQEESSRLEQLFKLAREEAELRGYEMGFRVTTDGYEFLLLGSEGNWLRYDQGPLRPRPVELPLELTLIVDGKRIPPVQPAGDSSSLSALRARQQAVADENAEAAAEAEEDRQEQRKEDARTTDGAEDKALKAVQPQVFLLSSGETTPFVLEIGAIQHDTIWRIEADPLGNLKREREDLKP